MNHTIEAIEKIEEKFDFSKIIVDPSKLVKGKRYYAADLIVELVEHFEEGATIIFDKAKPLSPDKNMEVAFAEDGMWYSLWYPVEEELLTNTSSSSEGNNKGEVNAGLPL